MKPKAEVKITANNVNDQKVTLLNYKCSQFEYIKQGIEVIEVETSKAVISIEAETDGYIFILVEKNSEVPVGSVVALIFDNELDCKSYSPVKSACDSEFDKSNSRINFSKKALQLMAQLDLASSDFFGYTHVKLEDVETVAKNRKVTAERDTMKLIALIPGDHSGIALYGAGLQGCIIKQILEAQGLKVAAFVDTRPDREIYFGLPVLRKNEINLLFERGVRKVHVCIGNGRAKAEVGSFVQATGFEIIQVIDRSANISPSAQIGVGVFIGPQVLIGPEARIGDWCQINNAATIAHHSELGEGVMIADACHVGGTVKIGSMTQLGIGVTVNRDISIGSGCSVVSGVNITASVPDGSIVKFKGEQYLVVKNKY
jgi:sugar O-acyltransferase (sialic acid O-acetyltransferase NeuD family)